MLKKEITVTVTGSSYIATPPNDGCYSPIIKEIIFNNDTPDVAFNKINDIDKIDQDTGGIIYGDITIKTCFSYPDDIDQNSLCKQKKLIFSNYNTFNYMSSSTENLTIKESILEIRKINEDYKKAKPQ